MAVDLERDGLPQSFYAMDRASLRAQRQFLWSTRVQLILLLVASAIGVASWAAGRFNIGALIAGSAFALAALLRFVLLRSRPHRIWYEGRAGAESIKTLAWRYAVGGNPLPLTLGGQAEADFECQAREIAEQLEVVRDRDGGAEAFGATPGMAAVRGMPLEERRDRYLRGRILDQLGWYRGKAAWNRARARFWGTMVLALQIGAAIGAFLKGFGVVDVDLFGLAAATVAAAAAWLETKQHGTLASAYAVTADELAKISELVETIGDEGAWARFVGEAEGAISREHSMWKAASSQRQPASLT
jgi:hypothetical protein